MNIYFLKVEHTHITTFRSDSLREKMSQESSKKVKKIVESFVPAGRPNILPPRICGEKLPKSGNDGKFQKM